MSETTSFVYEGGGELVPLEDAQALEESKKQQRREFSKRTLAEDEHWMLVPEFIREREWPMFQTMKHYILEQVADYIKLKAETEASKSTSYNSTSSKEYVYKELAKDMQSSQVLDRLLSGKKLLPTPPPLSYYHHWYDLVDDGEAVCIDVTTHSTTKWVAGVQVNQPSIRIDGEGWNLISEGENEEGNTYVVQWKDTEYIYELSRMTEEDFTRLLHPRQRKLVTKDSYSWKLNRLEKEDGN